MHMSKSKVLNLSGPQALGSDIVEAVLRRRGHTVVSAKISSDALIISDNYDLVILEIDGTDPDAFLACQRVREHSRVPLLLLIPPSSRSQGVRGLDLGADGYVVMPVDRRELVARAEALMRRYRG